MRSVAEDVYIVRRTLSAACFGVLLLAVLLVMAGCESQRGEGSQPQDCSDGNDNDGDGRVDCEDSGCTGAPDCSTTSDDDDSSADSDGDDDTMGDDDTAGDDDTTGDDDTADDDDTVGDDDSAGDDDSGADDDEGSHGHDGEGFSVDCTGPGQVACAECYDGLDNDNDGGADCDDPEALAWDGEATDGCAAVRAFDGDPSTTCP